MIPILFEARFGRAILFAAAIVLAHSLPVTGQTASPDTGQELVEKLCSGCHAVGVSDRSHHSAAPAFRDVLKRYPAKMLAEALAEGIMTGHPDMPEYSFESEQIAAILAYLERLAENGSGPR